MLRSLFDKAPLISCFVCGGLAAFALAPASVWPAALALSVSLLGIASASSAYHAGLRAFMTSWGWCATSLYWIGHSLFIEGGVQLLLLPVVVLGLPAFLALFWGAFSFVFYRFSARREIRIIWLALGVGCADIARSMVFTGFPWNVTGHIFGAHPLSSQAIFFVGQHSLNILAMACIAAGASVCIYQWRNAFVLAIPVFVVLGLSADRLDQAKQHHTASLALYQAGNPMTPTADIRILQPAIDQAEKWVREKQIEHLAQMTALGLSDVPVPELVILPESALAMLWPQSRDRVAAFTRQITPFDGQLLSGILRTDKDKGLYNSVILLDHDGQHIQFYDKKHLVPFGEYVPFRFLPFIDVIAGPVDFNAGSQIQEQLTLSDGRQIALLICYEVIFPQFLSQDPQNAGADVIINLTNDGWFGQTAGPYQHLEQARLRAIEEAKPLIRVANTGISAGFDAFGTEIARIGLNQRGSLDFHLSSSSAQGDDIGNWRGLEVKSYRSEILLMLLAFFVLLCLRLEKAGQTEDKK